MTVSFGSKSTPSSGHPHGERRLASHPRRVATKSQGASILKALPKAAMIALPIMVVSWVAHVGNHALLKGKIQSKGVAVSVFEGKNPKLEKLKSVLNADFMPDSTQIPFRTDTVFIPDNTTHKEPNRWLKTLQAVITTPALEPKEIKAGLIKLEDTRQYQNFEIDSPSRFNVRVGDGIFWDENGGKYLPIEYYQDKK